MKKLRNLMLLAVAALCAVACEKEDEPAVVPAQAVAGSYAGWTSASFAYTQTPMIASGETVVLTATGDQTVRVAFRSETWGEFTLDATVVEAAGTYRIAGSGQTLMGMSEESRKEYPATVEGTVVPAGATQLLFDVPSVMGGLKITFTEGDAPAE